MPIELEHVSCVRGAGAAGQTRALNDVTLTLRDGEILGILGATGSGKTTLLQLAAGLLRPSAGRVLLDGQDLAAPGFHRAVLRSSVGMIFQNPAAQLFETTVERDVAFALQGRGSREERIGRVREALEAVGLDFDAVRSRSPLTLSGGEQRRAAIAGVLVCRPRFLLCDEPAAGLDARGRALFRALLTSLRSRGVAAAVISHDPDELAEIADRIAVLDSGQLTALGPPEAVFSPGALPPSVGSELPAARRIAGLLADRGIELPPDIVRRGQLLSALEHLLGKEEPA